MREKLVTIGDDFWIENSAGQRVFKVDCKALRVRDTLNFEDAHGNVLCKIQERKLRVKDSMEVEGPHGDQAAMVKKALISTDFESPISFEPREVNDAPIFRARKLALSH